MGHGLGNEAADGGCALYVDAEDNVLSAGEGLAHVGFGDTLIVAVDDGIFQEFVGVDHFGEFANGHEVVVDAFFLIGPAGPGGSGYDEVEGEVSLLHQRKGGIFADAAGPGYHHQDWMGLILPVVDRSHIILNIGHRRRIPLEF